MSSNINIIVVSEFPKPISQTIWVVASSFFFLVPATYAFLNVIYFQWLYLYASLSVCTTICSINHWRKAEDGVRRKIDRVAAWTAFLVYVITGFIYLPNYLSIATLTTITTTFAISDSLSQTHHPYWPRSHVLFHLSVSLTKCCIIYYIKEAN